MIVALAATAAAALLLLIAAVILWKASGQWRSEYERLMKDLLDERNRHLEERKAWARAAADERAQLLAAAADERAALAGALGDARAGGSGYVVPPWPAGEPERRHVTEDDEIEAARQAMVREIEAQAAARGVDLSDSVPEGIAS